MIVPFAPAPGPRHQREAAQSVRPHLTTSGTLWLCTYDACIAAGLCDATAQRLAWLAAREAYEHSH